MTKKTKVLATSIASIAMCASIAVGGTFALFTSESEVNVAVTSGKVKNERTRRYAIGSTYVARRSNDGYDVGKRRFCKRKRR